MAAASLEDVQAELLAWGLIERDDEGLAWTRRFRAAVMREAAQLAAEERAGRKPEGSPLATAVAGALAGTPLPEGASAGPQHARFLYAVELAALPESVRALMGA